MLSIPDLVSRIFRKPKININFCTTLCCKYHKRAIDCTQNARSKLVKLIKEVQYRVEFRVILRASLTFAVVATAAAIPALASRVHRAPTSGHSRHHLTAAKPKKLHGQQGIDSDRATAIQTALIREHYLSGEPSKTWDSETQAAMIKFQADQEWQTKLTPDSRALIKLGLGPNHSGAINAGAGVSFNQLNTPLNMPETQVQGFVAGSGTSH